MTMRARPPLLGLALLAAGPALADGPELVNTGYFGGVAIGGYDTVAYFTDGKPVKGSEAFAYDWLGTPWHFVSDEHRRMFEADPARYAPQFGGYCALGVSYGHAAVNVDPEAFRIIDGKLYLNYDTTYVEELDGPGRDAAIARAEANWADVAAAQAAK
jgi:YHS domain-containing protein